MELLEIPQVVDMCVRNNSFDEALELTEYSLSLALRHAVHLDELSSPTNLREADCKDFKIYRTEAQRTNRIITSIVKGVFGSMTASRTFLLDQLRMKSNIAACLKHTAYLKRLYDLQMRAIQTGMAAVSDFQADISSLHVTTEAARGEFSDQYCLISAACVYFGGSIGKRAEWEVVLDREFRVRLDFIRARDAQYCKEAECVPAKSPSQYVRCSRSV